MTKSITALSVLVVCAALTGCGSDTPEQMVASARTFLANSDQKSAIIQLKSALQQQPNSGEARLLLAQALLDSGDGGAAAVEFDKALALDQPKDKVLPPLARALIAAGELKRLVASYADTQLTEPAAIADLKSSLAVAYGGLARRDEAEKAVDEALKAVPGYGRAVIVRARLDADSGKLDNAIDSIAKLVAAEPKNVDALLAQAELVGYGKRDPKAALESYRQAIAVAPSNVVAHNGAMTMVLAMRDVDAAQKQLEEMKKLLPGHPQTLFIEGNVALLARDYDKAKELVDQLIRIAPDNAGALQLAGAVAYGRSEFLQAESHLARALQIAPTQDAARRLLALTYLRSSRPGLALNVLEPLVDRPRPTAQTYSLLAQAQLQSGNIPEAQANFTKATQLDPNDTRSKAALAATRMALGDASGLTDLESLAAADSGTDADLPLITALVQRKNYAAALTAIDKLEAKLTGGPQPMTWNLRGQVHLSKGDKPAARAAFEKALEIKPAFFPAASALAGLDLADNNPTAARGRFDAVLKAEPNNAQALLAIALLQVRTQAPRADILSSFAEAIKQAPNVSQTRTALIDYLLAVGDHEQALTEAQRGITALTDSAELRGALGRAQLASGDFNQAIASFNQWAAMRPGSAQPLLLLANAQLAANNPTRAAEQLQRALKIDPTNLPAQRILAEIYVRQRQYDSALKVTGDIIKQRAQADVGYIAEGNVYVAQKKWEQALASYRAGLKAVPGSSELGARVNDVLVSAGRPAEAQRQADQWMRDRPKDARFLTYLGDAALARRDNEGAEARYRGVLKIEPENPMAMNNVAWLLASASKPGAVEMAQEANRLMPNRATLLDTLALALAREKKFDKAIETMRQATALAPTDGTLRINLARLLVEAGDKNAAKVELEEMVRAGSRFARQDEARELLKTL